ncbi:MAG: FAD-linked oxidase C-terminal domain-containing protein [Ferrimicrobium sp.]
MTLGTELATFVDLAIGSLGAEFVITDREARQGYCCDGLASHRATPAVVVLPGTSGELIGVVRALARLSLPFVARGSGTGLSGGAMPDVDGVLVVTARLDRILEIDPASRLAVCEPGVINAQLSRAAAPYGLYFAPDPSSQIACSLGGNVAENSGGAHCFKYGFTTNHILGCELVTPTGEVVTLGGETVESPGYDLRGYVIGSEGTLGIVTKIVCRLLPLPAHVRTLIAYFDEIHSCADAVTAVIGGHVVPAAIEMMDQGALRACEEATGAGLIVSAKAALLVELDGAFEEVEESHSRVVSLCYEHGATSVHLADSEAERNTLWRARKAAFAAAGRVAPAYIVQDGVIPRTALPRVLEAIGDLSRSSGLAILNVFHAGDGNLHPLVTFDPAVDGQPQLAEDVAGEILSLCLAEGGSLTGEHGIGIDKVCHMPEMFSDSDLAIFGRLRDAFDPKGICNRGKVLPTPRLCGERPGVAKIHPLEAEGVASRW